jgi:hypothetical protein
VADDRGAGRTFLSDAAGDLGGDLKAFLVAAVLVLTGAGVGYLVAEGEGVVLGGLAGGGVFLLVVAWWALSWAWQAGRSLRERTRR